MISNVSYRLIDKFPNTSRSPYIDSNTDHDIDRSNRFG